MKLTIVILLLIPFLSALTSSASSPEPIRDLDGLKLLRGKQYYILPVIRGRGGGLTLAKRNNSCPFAVAQDQFEVNNGLPVTFFPASSSRDGIIRLSTDVNIGFRAATICVQSTVWRLGDVDSATGRRYVVTGGVKGNPGLRTVSNWFKIEKSGEFYKLVFCPTVCPFCKVVCGDLGVFIENGRRWLGFSNEPLLVTFKEASHAY